MVRPLLVGGETLPQVEQIEVRYDKTVLIPNWENVRDLQSVGYTGDQTSLPDSNNLGVDFYATAETFFPPSDTLLTPRKTSIKSNSIKSKK